MVVNERERSPARLRQLANIEQTAGSNPAAPIGTVSQLADCLACNEDAPGSNPGGSIRGCDVVKAFAAWDCAASVRFRAAPSGDVV